MKTIDKYILEKFQITTNSTPYACHPKDKFELRKILEERLAKNPNADLNDIDVSKITDMGYKGFPDDKGLFEDLDPHNIKIDQWNVSNAKDMSGMFSGCDKFTGKGLEYWDVSNVENMESMFYFCYNFNCDLSNWDISNVVDMRYIFYYCKNFTGKGLEKWNLKKRKVTPDMFWGCYSLKKYTELV